MAAKALEVESIDRVKDDIFVLSFSDETAAILTGRELAEYFADRRMIAKGFTHMLSA
jgi:hypothetical protein